MAFDWNKAKESGKRSAYKTLQLEDIVSYCKENGKVEWLRDASNRLIEAAKKHEGERKRDTYTISELRRLFLTEVIGIKPNPTMKKDMRIQDRIEELLKDC